MARFVLKRNTACAVLEQIKIVRLARFLQVNLSLGRRDPTWATGHTEKSVVSSQHEVHTTTPHTDDEGPTTNRLSRRTTID